MRQAANLKDLELPMLLPGIKVNTSPDNYHPIRQMQLAAFNARVGCNSVTSSAVERTASEGAARACRPDFHERRARPRFY
jgi:hypothetical protein